MGFKGYHGRITLRRYKINNHNHNHNQSFRHKIPSTDSLIRINKPDQKRTKQCPYLIVMETTKTALQKKARVKSKR